MTRIIIYTIAGAFTGVIFSFIFGPIITAKLIEHFLGPVGAIQGTIILLLSHIFIFGFLGAIIAIILNKKKQLKS